MTLIDLLETIKVRPALYIGGKDICALRHFLSGYVVAMREIDHNYSDEVFAGFTVWLAERYKDDRDYDWNTLISVHEAGSVNTDTFFRLFEEYLSECRR